MHEWYRIALEMYHETSLPQGLFDRLEQVNHYCILAGGTLRSRQVVATIIAQWEAECKR